MKLNTGNWSDVEPITGGGNTEPLTLGGHYLYILKAEVMEGVSRNTGEPYQMLKLAIDTTDKDSQPHYFMNRWKVAKQWDPSAQWSGNGYGIVFVPFPDEEDRRKIGRWLGFKKMLEDSNPGFKWNETLDALKGKEIGGVFRDEEFYSNNGEIMTTQKLAWFCAKSAVKDATAPKPRLVDDGGARKTNTPPPAPPAQETELPFDL